jgi:hypothetical protein
MRLFTTIKTGYTTGASGCTGEYYTTTLINSHGVTASLKWNGLFGAEYRVAEYLRSKGYKEFYVSAEYGKLNSREIHKPTNYSEWDMLKNKLPEAVKNLRGVKK